MSILKRNIVANLAGNIWQGVMGLAFIPLYIKFMGPESYGIVGIFATIQSILVILDMGLSPTLTREMARLSVLPGKEQEMRDLVRSLEAIYWCIAVLIGIVITTVSSLVAYHWVKPEQLSPQAIENALRIMGVSMVLQWPASLYSGGLTGLDRQLLLNIINMGASTLRGAGTVIVLWLVSPTIQAFFYWQTVTSMITTCLLSILLWQSLPRTEKRPSFQKDLLLGVWRFAAAISGISLLSTLLLQLDKIVLSKMLSLETFGYYTIAGVVSSTLYRFVGPVFTAIYPRFVQLVSLGNQDGLKQLYHKSCQFVSVCTLPTAVVIALFSYDILFMWTGNPKTAEHSHVLLSVLICGTAFVALNYVPFALQLADGWTKLSLFTNLIAIILILPSIVFMTRGYGAQGGATVSTVISIGSFFLSIHFMYRRLLPSEKWRWYWEDIGIPMISSLLVAGVGRYFIGDSTSQFMAAFYLAVVSISTLAITAISTPVTRTWLLARLLNAKLVHGR